MKTEQMPAAPMKLFHREAFRVGTTVAVVVIEMIYVGSRGLRHFDWALATYATGTIFAAFAVAYRYALWAQRPPTKMYLRRGIQAFTERSAALPRNIGRLGRLLLDNFVLQKFITERSIERWMMHACLSWGG